MPVYETCRGIHTRTRLIPLDAWPIDVQGIASAYRNRADWHEVAYVVAEFHDNTFAHIELSWLDPGKVRDVVVVGSNGALTIDCLNQRVFHRDPDGVRQRRKSTGDNRGECRTRVSQLSLHQSFSAL